MDSQIAYYLQRLRLYGQESTHAYHSLLEIDLTLISDLIEAYTIEKDIHIRTLLIEIIGEHRRDADVGFLGVALQDHDERIWKAALDALVKINTRSCLNVLLAELSRLVEKTGKQARLAWIDEAIHQLEEPIE